LASDANLHRVQRSFLEYSAFQCGYCTPGMILATVALLRRNPTPTVEEIRTALVGNLCRCGTYPRIIKAVRHAAQGGERV
jgi:aerobic-type carbon monoxide dehydrogenase small subunit (CoxS/CutS family)